MLDTALGSYQKASFRGVPFLFTSNRQTGGRKYKKFEFPKKNTRSFEDLGRYPREYEMVVTIANPTFEYKQAKNELIAALETEGPGILIHPTDGVVQVFSDYYRLDENLSHTGVANFKLKFWETGDEIFPIQNFSAASVILRGLTNFISLITNDVANFWSAVSNFQGNIEYSANLIFGLVELFTNSGKIATNEIDTYSFYLKSINSLNDNAYQYADDASSYAANIQDIFSLAGQLNNDNLETLKIFDSFFNYSIPSFESITVGTDQRLRNRLITQQLINSQSLVYSYLVTSNTTFTNDDQIIQRSNILNSQFAVVITNNSYINVNGESLFVLSDDTLRLLEKLRSEAHKDLKRKINSTPKIIEIFVQDESLLSIVYKYYGNLDLYKTIYDLNDLTDATNISGTLRILTNENQS